VANHGSKLVLKETKVPKGWGDRLARDIDAAIATLAAGREVVSVSTLPLLNAIPQAAYGGDIAVTYTMGAIVTVVWREES
jgi:hypothetical protein